MRCVGVQVHKCFKLLRSVERLVELGSRIDGRCTSSGARVVGKEGIQKFWVWVLVPQQAVLSSGEFRSTKACALSCVVFVCVGFCICFVSDSVMYTIHVLQGMFDVCVV